MAGDHDTRSTKKQKTGANSSKSVKVLPSATGTAFTFYSNYMGQGDCTMIKCPDGKVIVIDCGSAGGLTADDLQSARNHLREIASKGKNNNPTQLEIEALIITHIDQDHWNKIKSVFDAGGKDEKNVLNDTKVKINRVFVNTRLESQYPGTTPEISYALNPHKFDCHGDIYEITINNKERSVKYFKKDNTDQTKPNDSRGPNSSFEIKANTVENIHVDPAKESKWSIKIIAGNVGSEQNAKSLVTFISYGNQKAMIGGDATEPTEDFVVTQYGAAVKNVNIQQIHHHGASTKGSSSLGFIKNSNPLFAFVSVERYEDHHLLSKATTINNWEEKMKKNPMAIKTNAIAFSWEADVRDEIRDKSTSNDTNPDVKLKEGLIKIKEMWKSWIKDTKNGDVKITSKYDDLPKRFNDLDSMGIDVTKKGLWGVDVPTSIADDGKYIDELCVVKISSETSIYGYRITKSVNNPVSTAVYGTTSFEMTDTLTQYLGPINQMQVD